MRKRVSSGFSAFAIAAALIAAVFLVLAYANSPADRAAAGASLQGSPQPRLKQPPVKLDPILEQWKTMVIQKMDRELKAKLAATDEARLSRQLKDEALYRPTVSTARELPTRTAPTEAMRLTSIEPASGEPGDFIRFFFNQKPSSFSSVKKEVHFIVAPGRDVVAESWTSDLSDGRRAVVGRIPETLGGIPVPYNGRAYVNYDGKFAGSLPFTIKPRIEHWCMSMTRIEWLDDMSFGGSYGGWVDAATGVGIICHEMLPGFGDKADDEFWRTMRLKNGWVMEDARVEGHPAMNNIPFGCSVTSSRPGTDSPYIKVHWWFDKGAAPFVYYAYVIIKGPAGVPYK
jgi:hypothetical protein